MLKRIEKALKEENDKFDYRVEIDECFSNTYYVVDIIYNSVIVGSFRLICNDDCADWSLKDYIHRLFEKRGWNKWTRKVNANEENQ